MNLVSVSFKLNVIEVIEETKAIVVKDICDNVGLGFSPQYNKLKSDPTFQSKLIKVKTAGGIQEVFTIPLSKLNGWLFSINPNKVKPEVREKLIEYKNECFEVLSNHFNNNVKEHQSQAKDLQPFMIKTLDTIVSMNKNMESLVKSVIDTNNNMVRLKSEVKESLEQTNHKLSNLQVNTTGTKIATENTEIAVEDLKETVDKLEIYYRRDTLTSKQKAEISLRVNEKAEELSKEHKMRITDIVPIIFRRLKDEFNVPRYDAIKSESFADVLGMIRQTSLTYEEVGE